MSSDPAHIGLHHICLPSDKSVSKRIGGSSPRVRGEGGRTPSRPSAWRRSRRAVGRAVRLRSKRVKELSACLLSAELQSGGQLAFLHLLAARGQRTSNTSDQCLVVSGPVWGGQHRFDQSVRRSV